MPIVECPVALLGADLLGVHPALLAAGVVDERVGTTESELSAQRLQHAGRYRAQILEERAEEAHCRELKRVAEPVVFAAFAGDSGTVGVIQVEVAREPLCRRVAVVPTVALTLRGT